MIPEECQSLLSDIRNQIADYGSYKKIALMVQSAEARPFLRELTELEFPDLMIISQEEVLPESNPTQTESHVSE